jgi:hypothetical protein
VISLFCSYSHFYPEGILDFQGEEISASKIGHKGEKQFALELAILVGFFHIRLFAKMMSIGMLWGYLFE